MGEYQREISSEHMDINDSKSNALAQGKSYKKMLEEDIVRGIASERQYEIWMRVKILGWKHKEVAEFFECTEGNIKRTINTVNNKTREFRVAVRSRGGYLFP